jgi:hypothetical protein
MGNGIGGIPVQVPQHGANVTNISIVDTSITTHFDKFAN